MAALRADRVNHAYLFSGPRGCGKTTSARILARCLNCAEGPTDTPCGKCASCVELARDGGGSLDVVEIDAASHNGVDDARDLRERAVFAPARDRFKIFILDEAHMVTPQGFNALLKIVEEPPEHVKFIFATTEPEKVIGTIRSRTHHYPFRLVPPAELMAYLGEVSSSEGVEIEEGVLPLVVRAGGGSVRDSLSLLDQLVAGSDNNKVLYERAAGLLGFTHDELLNEVIDAFASNDPVAAFNAIDRVIQTGQDGKRFLDDLLEKLRDLIIAISLGDQAKNVLRGLSPEQITRLTSQAAKFGSAELTQIANTVNQSLQEFSGATSPRLHLELLCAKILVPAASSKPELANSSNQSAPQSAPTAAKVESKQTGPASPAAPATPTAQATAASTASTATAAPAEPVAKETTAVSAGTEAKPKLERSLDPASITVAEFRAHWDSILDGLAKTSRSAWAVAFTTKVIDFQDGVLTLLFQSARDVEAFKDAANAAEVLRQQIFDTLGVTVKYKARIAEAVKKQAAPEPEIATPEDSQNTVPTKEPQQESQSDSKTFDKLPDIVDKTVTKAPAASKPEASKPAASKPAAAKPEDPKPEAGEEKYGESLLREVLGATPVDGDS